MNARGCLLHDHLCLQSHNLNCPFQDNFEIFRLLRVRGMKSDTHENFIITKS